MERSVENSLFDLFNILLFVRVGSLRPVQVFQIAMGKTRLMQNLTSDETATPRASDDWQQVEAIDLHDRQQTMACQHQVALIERPLSSSSSHKSINSSQNGWALPLESLVLDNNKDHEIPLNFLNVYPAILQRFPGPPCEALGRTITYLQALFTESPGFHPYVTHLPYHTIPTDEGTGRFVAEVLERRLIRISQHLFAFFYGDINVVRQYIETCPAELIPRPVFVISPSASDRSASLKRMINGVDGFNNSTKAGEKVWQSPAYPELSQLPPETQQKFRDTLHSNLEKISLMIRRKQSGALPNPGFNALEQLGPRRTPQDQLVPPRPQTVSNFPSSSVFSGPPLQPPQPFGTPNAGPPMSLPRVPPIFHVPPPIQSMQCAAHPQPNVERVQPAAAPATQAGPKPQIATAPVQDHPLKDDIKRLEAKISELLEAVDRNGTLVARK